MSELSLLTNSNIMEYPTVFDENKRYVVTNWTKEDFTGTWNGRETVIEKGNYKELPEYLAYHFTKHLVDREMMKDGKTESLASAEARRPYEEKTMTILADGVDSPALAKIKEEIRKQVLEESKNVKKVEKVDESAKEFAAIK